MTAFETELDYLRDALEKIRHASRVGDVSDETKLNLIYDIACEALTKKPEISTTHKLYTILGKSEVDVLHILYQNGEHRQWELERSGYARAIMKLEACEFIRTYETSGIRRVAITNAGRQWIETSQREDAQAAIDNHVPDTTKELFEKNDSAE